MVKLGACVCELEPYDSYKVYMELMSAVTLTNCSSVGIVSGALALCYVVGSRFGEICRIELKKEWVCDGYVWRRYALWCELFKSREN